VYPSVKQKIFRFVMPLFSAVPHFPNHPEVEQGCWLALPGSRRAMRRVFSHRFMAFPQGARQAAFAIKSEKVDSPGAYPKLYAKKTEAFLFGVLLVPIGKNDRLSNFLKFQK